MTSSVSLYSHRVHHAYAFAIGAHASIGQERKYSGKPYWVHPVAVFEILASHFGPSNITQHQEGVLMAALLHDVVEDVSPLNNTYSPSTIEEIFGGYVYGLILEVTSMYTKTRFPAYNREQRKSLETERLLGISNMGKLIKFADIIDNTATLKCDDPEFAPVYFAEKREFLEKAKATDGFLHKDVFDSLRSRALTQINQ